MPLESLTTGGANVKNLTIEDPHHRQRLPFDPERDMEPKDWETLRRWLRNAREERNMDKVLRQALALTILGRPVDLLESERMTIMESMMENRQNKRWGPFFQKWVSLAFFDVTPPAPDKTEWQHINNHVLFDTGMLVGTILFEKDSVRMIGTKFNWLTHHVISDMGDIEWNNVLLCLLTGRQPKLSEEQWQQMHTTLGLWRDAGAIDALPLQLAGMWMLSVGKIERTPKGLRVPHPDKSLIEPSVAPLPDLRKFTSNLPY